MDASKTGSFIAALRTERGITQAQLAAELLVSDKAISRWETGRGMPDIENLEALATALNVSVAELLRGERIANPLPADEAGSIAEDALALARQLLHHQRTTSILMGFVAGFIVVALLVIHLTSPIAIVGSQGALTLETLSDGRLAAVLGPQVAGWSAEEHPGEDGATELSVSCHRTLWHDLFGPRAETLAPLGNASKVDRIYYYPTGGVDELIYVREGAEPSGYVQTLPRLAPSYWIILGIAASLAIACVILLMRRRQLGSPRARARLVRLALLPASLALATLILMIGRWGSVYDLAHLTSGILLVGMGIYVLALLTLAQLHSRAAA